MTHTPGPWVAVEWHGVWSVDMPEGESSPHRIEVFHPAANTPDNIEADARLIAAAPELLEIVKMLHGVLQHEPATYGGDLYKTSASRELVLEVLAKAEGRVP